MTDETEAAEGLTTLSRDEILALIASDPKDFFAQFLEAAGYEYSNVADEFEYGDDKQKVVNGFTLEIVHEEGGGEGEGENVERVFAIKEVGGEALAYVQLDGFYSSYEGTEWEDSVTVVYPRQVVVTQYFTEKE